MASNRRQSLHKNNAKADWKTAFRQRCLLDLKNGRNIYINSLRGIPAVDVAKKIISGQCNTDYQELTFDELMSTQEEVCEELATEIEKLRVAVDDFENFEANSLENAIDKPFELICPLCLRNNIQIINGLLVCVCGLSIDTKSDCVTLDQIRHNWDEIVQLHSTMCDKVPSYSCIPLEGRDFLCMTCSACDGFFIMV